jgi:hypothetical protein
MSLIERILACEGCGYSGSTFGNADWLTVGMACPNGCGVKVTAFVPEQLAGAVDLLRKSRGYVALYYATHEPDDPAAVIRLLADIDNAIAGGR